MEWYPIEGYQSAPGHSTGCWTTEGIATDERGLRLTISGDNNTSYAAGIMSTQVTEYGRHCFFVDGPIDKLSDQVVFGLYLYSPQAGGELDIEFSNMVPQWFCGDNHAFELDISPKANAVFGVPPKRSQLFTIQLNGTFTTQCLDWQADQVRFYSLHGHYRELPEDYGNYLIHEFTYSGDAIPGKKDRLHIYMGLWPTSQYESSLQSNAQIYITDATFPINSGS
jgi:hypothetical protein